MRSGSPSRSCAGGGARPAPPDTPRCSSCSPTAAGLRIFTIGVGARARESLFGFSSGNTDLDAGLLKRIASITGGEYFRATNPEALQGIYRRINRLEPTAGHKQWLRPAAEWFTWPLALALLLSVPATWLLAQRI
jgi:Ca-activated chloride channel family protein